MISRGPLIRSWLNRNVIGIGLADLAADANYEMILAVLPLFITAGLGAPVVAVGLVEGVADGSSAVVKVWSGWYSDRVAWRKALAAGGYGATGFGFSLLVAATTWPQVLLSRALAWMGRGLRQPVRSAMLAGSVEKRDLGKAFGLHEAMDTAGALIGPAVAFLLLSTHHGFRTVFAVAIIPGVLAFALFALVTRDPRQGAAHSRPPDFTLPRRFWRLMLPIGVFGFSNFTTAFFTLRVAQVLRPEVGVAAATAAAVGFYLAHNAVGTAVSFPAGWLADRVGKAPVLAAAYATFGVACAVAIVGHGWVAVGVLALLVGAESPVVSSVEQSLSGSLVDEPKLGTAYGVLNGINGAGDLGSSVIAGVLYSASPAAAFSFGAAFSLIASAILWAWRGPLSPSSAGRTSASRHSSTA
ncbi:MAG TPA: MFS transporter [Candidatus Dormibacteraeota bacterium]|nr:MFS transporter [Candidatus Dormibacteraeota bacterium]